MKRPVSAWRMGWKPTEGLRSWNRRIYDSVDRLFEVAEAVGLFAARVGVIPIFVCFWLVMWAGRLAFLPAMWSRRRRDQREARDS